MNKTTIIVVVVIALVGIYGAYRVIHHIQRLQNQQAAIQQVPPTTSSSSSSSSPSAAMNEVGSNEVTMTKTSASLGVYLTDQKGNSLYTFDKDQTGVSNCSGKCATTWPPFLLTGTKLPSPMPANLGTIKRSDGSTQFTWKDKPLYYYSLDKKPGDVVGDGVGGVWHISKP